VQAPLDVTVLRSGIPDTLPGRSLNLCERGIAAVLAGELMTGESVGVEIRLPLVADPVRARALVRHHDKLRCGMEFVGLSVEQHAAIRDWVELSKAPAESDAVKTADGGSYAAGAEDIPETKSEPNTFAPQMSKSDTSKRSPRGPNRKPYRRRWTLWLFVIAVLVAVLWWRWNRAWKELESGLANPPPASGEQAQAHVPAETMEKLLVHRVDPEYPAAARPGRLQGIIVLDVTVGRDGSVVQARPLNGPEVLATAAVEALRWWKFQPYRVNGEAVVVETTVAVEFKP
jgi:TonB family protein